MEQRKYLKAIFILTAGGVLFSGYLSAKKLFTGICAFNESCPYFLGHPACFYGFGLFAILFVVALLALLKKIPLRGSVVALGTVSFLGILFAGKFVVSEMDTWFRVGRNLGYGLVLPTCAYGLVFYTAVFVLSLIVIAGLAPKRRAASTGADKKLGIPVERKYFVLWVGVAVILTLTFGTIYLTAQQVLRQGANDPQIQLAEDYAVIFANGGDPTNFDAPNKTDISQSLAPYLMVFDEQGRVIASTAELDGVVPALPAGVFKTASVRGEYRVTWQPKAGVRGALVVVPFKSSSQNGFVAVGRSLREVEKREGFVELAAGMFWVASIIALTLTIAALSGHKRRKHIIDI